MKTLLKITIKSLIILMLSFSFSYASTNICDPDAFLKQNDYDNLIQNTEESTDNTSPQLQPLMDVARELASESSDEEESDEVAEVNLLEGAEANNLFVLPNGEDNTIVGAM